MNSSSEYKARAWGFVAVIVIVVALTLLVGLSVPGALAAFVIGVVGGAICGFMLLNAEDYFRMAKEAKQSEADGD